MTNWQSFVEDGDEKFVSEMAKIQILRMLPLIELVFRGGDLEVGELPRDKILSDNAEDLSIAAEWLDELAISCEDTKFEDYQDAIDSLRHSVLARKGLRKADLKSSIEYSNFYLERWLQNAVLGNFEGEISKNERLEQIDDVYTSPTYSGEQTFLANLCDNLRSKEGRSEKVSLAHGFVLFRF